MFGDLSVNLSVSGVYTHVRVRIELELPDNLLRRRVNFADNFDSCRGGVANLRRDSDVSGRSIHCGIYTTTEASVTLAVWRT